MSGIVIGVVAGVIVAAIAIVFLYGQGMPGLSSLTAGQPPGPADNSQPLTTIDASSSTGKTSGTAVSGQTTALSNIEPLFEEKFLISPNSSKAFPVQIHAADSAKVSGSVIVTGTGGVMITVEDMSGKCIHLCDYVANFAKGSYPGAMKAYGDNQISLIVDPNKQQRIVFQSKQTDKAQTIEANLIVTYTRTVSDNSNFYMPSLDLTKIAQELHKGINNERFKNDRPPLSLNSGFSIVSKAHSEDMAKNFYFATVDENGKSPDDRAAALGHQCSVELGIDPRTSKPVFRGFTELISRAGPANGQTDPNQIVKSVIAGWMNEKDNPLGEIGARTSILSNGYTQYGLGVAQSSQGIVYVTVDLC